MANALAFIENETADPDPKRQMKLRLVAEEIFVNIVAYAYPNGQGEVAVSLSRGPDKLIIEFRDSGKPCDPLTRADPDISLPVDQREPGGLGLFMVRQLASGLSYRYENGENILTMEMDLGDENAKA
ncbi:MAG: ATP-binding protein [Clostridiales bacterium]|nr:ATP-binding protein [Clostridiales bacterium]